MRLRLATAVDVFEVGRLMRESDYQEFAALSTAGDREMLAWQLRNRFSRRQDVIAAIYDDAPVAIGGLLEVRPNVVSLLFFATDELPKVGKALTRLIKQELFPGAKAAGVHRIEAVAMVEHTEAHRWIEHLGLKPEGPPLRGFGKGGEAYQSFAWVRDDL